MNSKSVVEFAKPKTACSDPASVTKLNQTKLNYRWARLGLSRITALLIAVAGIGVSGPGAIAQATINYDSNTGQVQVNQNALDIQTGALGNASNIPLPASPPASTGQGITQPVAPGQLAPNTLEITPDVGFIDQAVNQALGGGYTLQPNTLQMNTQFDLRQRPGSHSYGEGIEVTVMDSAGNPQGPPVAAFVRGDGVTVGPNGQALPQNDQVSVSYGAQDTVVVRVLNLQSNNAAPTESGVYFTQGGTPIVEDVVNGGDRDFDDGDYLDIAGGAGQVEAIRTINNLTVRTETVETVLAPELREEEIIEQDETQGEMQIETVVEETRERGEIELTDSEFARIGHASGVRSETDEQLVYNRYASLGRVRAGSDGLTLAGQLAPLINNPKAPPTLVSGNLRFDPTVSDNEAGFTASLGISQFVNRTHRLARDMFGNVIENPEVDWPTLVEPTGWFNNSRLVGYVPAADGSLSRQPLTSVAGIFTLPMDREIVIAPADFSKVGRGDAAYTNNVGGLLVEKADGSMSFMPQWTAAGYAEEMISLAAGEATRIIYALVPQQPGQALKVGQTYAVSGGAGGYQIAAGGFQIISADRQPDNFRQELAEVYAVEDTMTGNNAVTELFNGVQGMYAEAFGSERMPTVDLDFAEAVDARVGNQLFAMETLAGDPGQIAYRRTTRAGGFYLSGALSAGIGNQRDSINRTTSTLEVAPDGIRTRRITNLFETPLTQIDTVNFEANEAIETSGTTFFDINSNGNLENITFTQNAVLSSATVETEIGRSSAIARGEETLLSSTVEEDIQTSNNQVMSTTQQTTTDSDTHANVSPLRGELSLGMVYNFGNTPWTAAANTVRAEVFAQGLMFGQSSTNIDAGWRAEAIFHPFGEVTREAHHYDAAGNVVPLYKTEPLLGEGDGQVMKTLTNDGGESVEVAVNRFVVDEAGDRIAQTVGTGHARGPGVYLRVEDIFEDNDSLNVAGGIQLTF